MNRLLSCTVIAVANLYFACSLVPSAMLSSCGHNFRLPRTKQIGLISPKLDLYLDSCVTTRRYRRVNLYNNKKSGPSEKSTSSVGNQRDKNTSPTFQIGDAVEVKWDGEWWPAVVNDVDLDKSSTRVRFCDSSALDEDWIPNCDGNIRLLREDQSAARIAVSGEVYSADDLCRDDDTPDESFWAKAGGGGAADMDMDFLDLLIDLHSSILPAGGHFLDLCTGSRSALPPAMESRRVEGVGLVRAQLERNTWLDSFVVADVNAAIPALPPASFDAVVCAGALPYLVQPLEVLRAARLALKPAGVLAIRLAPHGRSATLAPQHNAPQRCAARRAQRHECFEGCQLGDGRCLRGLQLEGLRRVGMRH
jgi:hypothetical protein